MPLVLGSYTPPSPDPEQPPRWGLRLARLVNLLLAFIVLLLVSILARPPTGSQVNAIGADQTEAPAASQPSDTPPAPTPSATPTPGEPLPLNLVSPFQTALQQGVLFLSIDEGGSHHLFAYQPLGLPLTRLTNGFWDDITPALSPDGARLAFASNRDGWWDLYLMDLASGATHRLTNTPQYDAAPSWSPDGNFLAYETYTGNLEIAIRAVYADQPFILLSESPTADFSPAWSPKGRQVAFVSTRSGEREVWLADLDKAEEERFSNLSQNPGGGEAHPAWSPDGSRLAWASLEDGLHNLYVWDSNQGRRSAGSGDWPAWSPEGGALISALLEPNQTLLAAYNASDPVLALPPLALPGPVAGLAWGQAQLPAMLPESMAQAARLTPTAPWRAALTPLSDIPAGRQHLVSLVDIQAPYPQLHDLVDEALQALRERTATKAGWDFLATLENAYVPLTAPLPPGMDQDWLYTGRAFAFTPLPINAGWVAVMPEAFGGQTYWRVYLRARQQDGSQGIPLHDLPWDFNARLSGNPALYDQGGRLAIEIPAGYWIDFTDLAGVFGWERLPALSTWRSAYPAARFNEFVMDGDLDWQSAMLELYPAEALITPTYVPPPTLTATPTPRWTPVYYPRATRAQPAKPILPVASPTISTTLTP